MSVLSSSLTPAVARILAHYSADNPGSREKLSRMLNHGRLGGTGKMVILPVDQGFEHGPARSFAMNPAGYDPAYHFRLAIESGCNAYAAPLGALEACSADYPGLIPLILKLNHGNSLSTNKDQAVTSTVDEALKLGCAAIGFTIYVGSDDQYAMFEEITDLTREAKAKGLAVVIWAYPRGGMVTKNGETALDIVAYGAHIACQLGAHIVKVKLPSDVLENEDAKKAYEKASIPRATMTERVRHIVQSCFNGRRIVVFSGGATKGEDSVIDDARAIYAGGGNGSIIGRNSFQRPYDDGVKLLHQVMDVYAGSKT